ncbi:MAG: N-acetylmuramidase family protein [Segetibacter sp.]
MAISYKKYIDSAVLLGVELAVIRAVAKVEGNGIGMIEGKPIILYEPHVFFKQLREINIKPVVSDICYPVWGSKPYPKGQKAQWERLERAIKINRQAALKSASWGMFQVMGYNFRSCGCGSLQAFVNAMYEGEDKHLELFINYIRNEKLDDELKNKDWRGFAAQYNGKYYYKNNYDVKLKKAYQLFS